MDAINQKISAGIPLERVASFSTDAGFPITRQALSNHRSRHLMTTTVRTIKQAKTTGVVGDLAPLVRNLVYAAVEEGTITPTLAEGLRAQEAVDRRAEKGADRDLMLVMAQVLTGGYTPPKVIEGQWVQLDAERAEDEGWMRQLSDGVMDDDRLRPPPTYRSN